MFLKQILTTLFYPGIFFSFKVNFIAALGGVRPPESVRKMLRKLETNSLWSGYSLRGKKAKNPFSESPLMRCLKSKFLLCTNCKIKWQFLLDHLFCLWIVIKKNLNKIWNVYVSFKHLWGQKHYLNQNCGFSFPS